MRYAAGARRLGRRRRLRRRGRLGRLHASPALGRALRPGEVPRRCARCPAASRSGWCWSACCAAPTRCCCSTSRTTSSTCPASAGSRSGSASRRRRCCSSATTASCSTNTATRVVTVELGAAGNTRLDAPAAASRRTTRPGADRFARFEELRRRWDEEHAKLKALVLMYKIKADVQRRHGLALPGRRRPGCASSRRPARRRSSRASSRSRCGCTGGRTGKRAVVCERPRADRADEAVRPRGLVRRAGRRARLQRLRQVALPAAARRAAAATPTSSTGRSSDVADRAGRRTPAGPGSAPGCGPGWFAQTHEHPELLGRTLLEILHRGDEHRDGMAARAGVPGRWTATSWRTPAEQRFESLSGGQQARFQILLLELSGATLLLLDEPTDNLDLRVGRGAGGRARARSRARCSRSPTTAGSPAASTGSWSSAPTARSTSPTSRSGTRAGWPGRARGR